MLNLIFIFFMWTNSSFCFPCSTSTASFLCEAAMLMCMFLSSGDVKHGTYTVFIAAYLLCRGWPLRWWCIYIPGKLDVPLLWSYVLGTYLLVQVLSRDILIIGYFGVLENWCHLANMWLITITLVLLGVLTVQLIPLSPVAGWRIQALETKRHSQVICKESLYGDN